MKRVYALALAALLAILAGCGSGGGGGNHAPTVSLTADKTYVTVSQDVNFTATAIDPDGDTLTYEWDFGDGTTKKEGQAEETHAYADIGSYTVRVTVSDGKDTADASIDIDVECLRVYGYIVDQADAGVPGVRVTLGDKSAITGADGRFDFVPVDPGEYTLAAAGGYGAHYVSEAVDVEVQEGQPVDLGRITAYQLLGCGVVIQSEVVKGESGEGVMRRSAVQPGVKQVDIAFLGSSWSKLDSVSSKRSPTRTLPDPDEAMYLIYLNWAPIAGADYYRVFYLDDPAEQVWQYDITDDPPNDPPVNDGYGNLQAYLDFDDELDMLSETGAGTYQFQVIAMSGESEVLRLPVISVSVGLALSSLPKLTYDAGRKMLQWTEVAEADGYRLRICTAAWDELYDTGMPLLVEREYSVAACGLTAGVHYKCHVDAHALDETGWTAEITRGIGGFIYNN